MPKVDRRAVLEVTDVQAASLVAQRRGPREDALLAWMYELGARASEPGLQLLRDVDLRAARVRPVHLKDRGAGFHGAVKTADWHALLSACRRTLPLWFEARPKYILKPEQATYLFPSASPGRCYVCYGSGQRAILKRDENGRRFPGAKLKCHHCTGTGKRWGISRGEVYAIITSILTEAGVPERHRHPHVLRHSIITHLLEAGVAPAAIQERVGHRFLSTTLEYVRATRAAAAEIDGRLDSLYKGKR